MTPQPSSSSDGSGVPPRHRPNLGDLAKDTTEMDLWAFDDLEPLEDESALPVRKSGESVVPVPRDLSPRRQQAREIETTDEDAPREEAPPKVVPAKESIRVNVNKTRPKPNVQGPIHSKAGSEFDDLDSWEDSEAEDAPAVSPVVAGPEPEPKREEERPVVVDVEDVASLSGPVAAGGPVVSEEPVRTEEPPAPSKGIPGVHLNLSGLEKLGLIILTVLLVAGGGMAYFLLVSRLPKGEQLAMANDFPIAGKHVTIQAADTYWRVPVEGGANADTFRRGAQLLPVLDLSISGGPAELRIFFRNAKGDLIGDSVNRQASNGQKVEAVATAGFEDLGMYAAYRTGLEKPWTVEVFEVAPGESDAKPVKLFEMQISTDRR